MSIERRLTRLEQETPPREEVIVRYTHRAADGTVTDNGPTVEQLIDNRCRERGYAQTDRDQITWQTIEVTFVEPPPQP